MTMLSYLNSKKNLLVFLYFFVFFFIGYSIFPDYGISLDEDNTRLGGFVSLKYIFEIFFPQHISSIDEIIIVPSMSDWNEWAIGPIFDIPTAYLEWILQIEDSRDFYLMRHFVNFLFFFVSVYFFFLLIKQRYNSWIIGILGSTFLIFSPRIFAHSFYNNKDIVFMSLFIITLYTGIKLLKKPNFINAIYFSFTSALAIDIRVSGLVLPTLILLFYIMNMLHDSDYKKKTLKPLLVFLLTAPIFITFFWPSLWQNPLTKFVEAFSSLSNFDVNIFNLYLGEYIAAKNLPWHYPIVWIFISTPFLYLILFVIGFIFILRRLIKRVSNFEDNNSYNDVWRGDDEFYDLVVLSSLLAPLIYIISFNSTLYDGWRHLYFIYPSFLMISLFGFHIIKILYFKKRKNLLLIITFLLISPTGIWMIENHPYQNIYFNFLVGKDYKNKFEVDYWGLSNLEALEQIAKNDDRKVNVSSVGTSDLSISKAFLLKKYRNKISVTNQIENSHYIINHYRNWLGQDVNINFTTPSNYIKYYEIKVDDVTINTVYKKID